MRKIDHHHCSGPGAQCDICGPDPRDAEIARLKAEVERLTGELTDADQVTRDALGHARAAWEGERKRLEADLAACAEMRAAAVGVDGRCRLCTARPREHRDNCALSRTDLGRGMVAVEREVVERLVAYLDRHGPSEALSSADYSIAWAERVALTDALLDGGKGRG